MSSPSPGGSAGTGAEYPWERPLGARPLDAEHTEFRVWAPRAERITLSLSRSRAGPRGRGVRVYETVAEAGAGADYRFVLDGEPLPDPCSRWQPDGLRGPSRVRRVPPARRGVHATRRPPS